LNYTKSILVGLCLFGLSIASLGQNVNRPLVPGIPGYLDPRTGSFKPMPQVPTSADEATVTPTTGTIVINLTVSLRQAFPGNEVYSCGLTISTSDASGLFFYDTNQVTATNNGGTVKCTVKVPYSWDLTSPNTDFMTIEYSVNAVAGTSGLPIRTANHGLAVISVPANGTTMTYYPGTWL